MIRLRFSRQGIAPFVYLLQKLFFRMTLFSFMLFATFLMLYGAGNAQQFLDKTQTLILNSLIFISITLFFFAIFSIVFTVLDTLLSKFYSFKKTGAIIFYIVCLALSAAVMIFARTVLVLAQ